MERMKWAPQGVNMAHKLIEQLLNRKGGVMKILIFFILFLLGCENNEFSQDSTSGVPICNQQFDRWQACVNTQSDSIPCGASFNQGHSFGERVRAYCGNLHFAPTFQENCQRVALERIPEFMKQNMERAIDRCT